MHRWLTRWQQSSLLFQFLPFFVYPDLLSTWHLFYPPSMLKPTIDSSTGKAVLVVCIFQFLVTFRRWFTISKEKMNYTPLFDFQIIHFLYRSIYNLLYPKFYNFAKTRPITVISSKKWRGWLKYRMTWFEHVYGAATCGKKSVSLFLKQSSYNISMMAIFGGS